MPASAAPDSNSQYTAGLQTLDAFLRLHGSSDGPFLLGNKYSIAEVRCVLTACLSCWLLALN